MKNVVFAARKDIKKRSHSVVRSHYLVLAFLMLVMVLFGTEFQYSGFGIGKNPFAFGETDAQEEGPGNRLSDKALFSPGEVIRDISRGEISLGSERAAEKARTLREKLAGSKILGMTDGVLAQVVNNVLSGKLFARLAQTVGSVTRSAQATGILFTIGSFLWYAVIFILLKNVYSAVIRRVYLDARVYRYVSVTDATWFAVVRKWLSACRAMLVVHVYQALWNVTIVGGLIKAYSYWAVPYIVAENPSVSPNRAVALSRKMMDGHKLELLKFQLSFIGWYLLSFATGGISDLLYAGSYRLAAYTEFYVMIREQLLAAAPDCTEVLNDPCLFRCPDRITLAETYFDVVDTITVLHENRVEPEGWRKRAADWFGIWLYSISRKRIYDEQVETKLAIEHEKRCMQGQAYPQRLSPLWKERNTSRQRQFSFIRSYTVWTLILLFICFCFVGWSWEVALHFMQTGEFVNRGTLHGPWLPIYGSGGIIVLILCSRFRKNPVAEFFSAIVLCGVLEYVSAWQLEMKYHQRWWSYDGYFLNLHGRICAEGLLVFGAGCCMVVYLVAPAFDYMISKLKQKTLITACVVLGMLFMADSIYSVMHPNMAEGAVESREDIQEEPAARRTDTDAYTYTVQILSAAADSCGKGKRA